MKPRVDLSWTVRCVDAQNKESLTGPPIIITAGVTEALSEARKSEILMGCYVVSTLTVSQLFSFRSCPRWMGHIMEWVSIIRSLWPGFVWMELSCDMKLTQPSHIYSGVTHWTVTRWIQPEIICVQIYSRCCVLLHCLPTMPCTCASCVEIAFTNHNHQRHCVKSQKAA